MSTAVMEPERPATRIHARDWSGGKQMTWSARLSPDATVGELTEQLRDKMNLPRGSYALFRDKQKLSRTDTVSEAEIVGDQELELGPEVKAG